MHIPDKVYPTYKVSTSKLYEQDVFKEYSTPGKHKTLGSNLLGAPKFSKSLASDASSSDSGFGSYDVASREMRQHSVSNGFGTELSFSRNKTDFAESNMKNVNRSEFASTSETPDSVIPNQDTGRVNLNSSIDYHETFQQYKLSEKIESLKTSGVNFRETGEYKKDANCVSQNEIRSPKNSPFNQEIKLDSSKTEIVNNKLDNSLRNSMGSQDEINTSDVDAPIYKQAMGQYTNNNFIEKAFKKSSNPMILTGKMSNHCLDEEKTRNSKVEGNVKVKPQYLDDELNDNASDIGARKGTTKKEIIVSQTIKPKKKTPKKRRDNVQCEEQQQYKREEKFVTKIDLKNPYKKLAKTSDQAKTQPLPPLHQKETKGPTPRSGRKDKSEKLPPIISKNTFKPKTNDTLPKRGTNSTCCTLPPVLIFKKSAVSKIPKPKMLPPAKKVMPDTLFVTLDREKTSSNILDVHKYRWKSPPNEKLPKISTEKLENLSKNKVIEYMLPIQKLPGVFSKMSEESVAKEWGDLPTFTSGFQKVANTITYPLKLCDMSRSDEKTSSKRLV